MLRLYLLCCLCLSSVVSYKILLVFPMPGKSHSILGEGYVRLLLKDGHEVTYVTPLPMKNTHPKLRQIDVSKNFEMLQGAKDILDFEKLLNKEVNLNGGLMFKLMFENTERTLMNENVLKLLKDPSEQFDLVIAEWLFSDLYSGIATVYNCPFIWASPTEPNWMILQLFDDTPNPAYTVDVMSTNKLPFSFFERAEELGLRLIGMYLKNIVTASKDAELYTSIFKPILTSRGRPLPPYEEVLYNASLVLGNSHVSLGAAVTLPQSYKAVGGYHIDPDVKPLPEDLQKLMDNAKEGVIYFSMGSNLKSKQLPTSIKKDLLKLFGSLKQTVIWKFEEALTDAPKNVHILQWAPQPSILAHPNCRLFVTHGGLLSTTETVHFGVPIVGLPVFGDQFMNVQRAANKGFAKRVDWSYNVAADLKVAIEEMFNDPKYAQKAKELSLIYHDRPTSPGSEAVHWVNHVIKTKGALHLRSPALMLPWYQKMYVDLAAVILVFLILVYALLKKLIKSVFGKKKSDTKKKN